MILEHLRRDHGQKRLRTLQRAHVAAIVGAKPPFAARNWLKVMRGLMAFAVNSGLRPDDPTQGVRLPKAKAGSIHTWTEDEIAQFEAAHHVGTKARLAMALLLYYGPAARRCGAHGPPAHPRRRTVDPPGKNRQSGRNPGAPGARHDHRRRRRSPDR